jgi:hypothetical protein
MKRFLIGLVAVLTGAATEVSAQGHKGKGGGHSGGRNVAHHAGHSKFNNHPKPPIKHTPFVTHNTVSGKFVGGHKSPVFAHIGTKPFGGIHSTHKHYHLSHGTPFKHGFFYHGKHHHHWTYRGYSPKYGCNFYWCPSTSCYYYWCEPAGCYYPFSYFHYAPPFQTSIPTQSVFQVQKQSVVPESQPGALPPGVPPLPQ